MPAKRSRAAANSAQGVGERPASADGHQQAQWTHQHHQLQQQLQQHFSGAAAAVQPQGYMVPPMDSGYRWIPAAPPYPAPPPIGFRFVGVPPIQGGGGLNGPPAASLPPVMLPAPDTLSSASSSSSPHQAPQRMMSYPMISHQTAYQPLPWSYPAPFWVAPVSGMATSLDSTSSGTLAVPSRNTEKDDDDSSECDEFALEQTKDNRGGKDNNKTAKPSSSSSASRGNSKKEIKKMVKPKRRKSDEDSSDPSEATSGSDREEVQAPKKARPVKSKSTKGAKGPPEPVDDDGPTPFNGEQRLAIEFQSLGSLTGIPQKMGRKEGFIPHGVSGTFTMYGERWSFLVEHAETVRDEEGDDRVCIRWTISNTAPASAASVSILETPDDARRREMRGISLCNKVFIRAMELRAQEYEKFIEQEKRKGPGNAGRISTYRSKAQSLRPQRFSEGPLLFGLRHKVVQDNLGVLLPS